MVGVYVARQKDLQTELTKEDVIGMGSYNSDSHNIQRYITPEGYVQNEGDIGVSTNGPYQIAYGAIVPKKLGMMKEGLEASAVTAADVPEGLDEKSNREERVVGGKPNFAFPAISTGVLPSRTSASQLTMMPSLLPSRRPRIV